MKIYLVDPCGFKHFVIITTDLAVMRKRAEELTDQYVLQTLQELTSKFVELLEKHQFLSAIRSRDETYPLEELLLDLQEKGGSLFTTLRDTFIKELYEKLPIIYNDFYLDMTGITIVFADGRVFNACWRLDLEVWRGERDWKIVEVGE
jgi:hypothetical protein